MSNVKTILLMLGIVILLGIFFTIRMNMRKVIVGAWTHGLWDNNQKRVNSNTLKNFEKNLGAKMGIAHIYVGWHELDSEYFVDAINELKKNQWTPMISSNPYFFENCKPSGLSLYKTISNGQCDEFIHAIAKRMKAINSPILFRFAWEMNIPANEWSVDYTQSTPAEFISAWRHIHTIFQNENALNVRFVFCPFVMASKSHKFSDLYPGDAYVDWIGLDGYNWGTTQSWSSWQSFQEVFGRSYKQLTQIAPAKPMLIGEVGTTDKGGSKPDWFFQMLEKEIPQNFPHINAVIFYDEDRTVQEHVDWSLQKDTQTLHALQKGLHNSLYTSEFRERQ